MIGVGLVLSAALATATGAGAAGVHFQHCGTLRGPGARFAILAHRARCQTARAGGFGCDKLGPGGTILPYSPQQPSINAEAL